MRHPTMKEFKTVFNIVPRVTVDLIIKDERGVLLIKRDIMPDKHKWHFPGGTLYYKETLIHAVKRKAREETGLEVRVKRFLGVIEFMKWHEPGYRHVVDLVFLVEPARGKIRGNKFGKHLKFFKRTPANMIPEQRKFLIHLSQGRKTSLHIFTVRK